ncbi:MAG TPA: hypothetical protein DDZ91_13825, partial [Firmicutes bacterium]|nr:hypothetical protein [Bacillota bacterium]
MKKPPLILLLSLSLILLWLTPSSAETTSVQISLSDRGVAFSLMQRTASSYFQLRVSELNPYVKESPVQIFPLFYLSIATKTAPELVWEKRKGKGWGKIAKEMGLPPNFHGKYMSAKNKHKKSSSAITDDQIFEEMMIIRFLHEYFGADPEVLFYWRAQGLTYDDLFLGINLSLRLKISPGEFFSLRLSGKDWRFIANKVRVPYSSLSQPLKPVNKTI